KTRAADEDEVAEPADLFVDVHDLLVNGIRIARTQDAAGDGLLGGNADQAVGRAPRGLCARTGLRAVILRGDLRRLPAWHQPRELRRLLQAGVRNHRVLLPTRTPSSSVSPT